MGRRLAHVAFNPGELDYMEIAPNTGISKIRPSEFMIRLTLEDAGLSGSRDKYGVAVLAIRRGRDVLLTPAKDEEIRPGDVLIIAGRNEELGKLHMSSNGK